MLTYADTSLLVDDIGLLVDDVDDIDQKSSVVVESFCNPYQTYADVC